MKMLPDWTVVGDAFQCKHHTFIGKLNFVICIEDYRITWGEQSDGADHDYHLTEFLCLALQHRLRLNYNIVQYKM